MLMVCHHLESFSIPEDVASLGITHSAVKRIAAEDIPPRPRAFSISPSDSQAIGAGLGE